VLLQPLKFTSGLTFRGQGSIGRVDGGTWILPMWGVTSQGGGGDQLGHGVACSAGLCVAIGGMGVMTIRMPCPSMCVAICSTATSLVQCCTLCMGLKMKTKGPSMAGLGDRCLVLRAKDPKVRRARVCMTVAGLVLQGITGG